VVPHLVQSISPQLLLFTFEKNGWFDLGSHMVGSETPEKEGNLQWELRRNQHQEGVLKVL
jgi:hypothetical protein